MSDKDKELEEELEEPEFPKEPTSKGTSSGNGYKVEARYNCGRPQMVCGRILNKEWVTIHFQEGEAVGIPVDFGYGEHGVAMKSKGLLTYQASEALRWWFHASARVEHNDICLETRIVKYEVKTTHSIRAISSHKNIGEEDSRTGVMPDWGVK